MWWSIHGIQCSYSIHYRYINRAQHVYTWMHAHIHIYIHIHIQSDLWNYGAHNEKSELKPLDTTNATPYSAFWYISSVDGLCYWVRFLHTNSSERLVPKPSIVVSLLWADCFRSRHRLAALGVDWFLRLVVVAAALGSCARLVSLRLCVFFGRSQFLLSLASAAMSAGLVLHMRCLIALPFLCLWRSLFMYDLCLFWCCWCCCCGVRVCVLLRMVVCVFVCLLLLFVVCCLSAVAVAIQISSL